MNYLLRCCLLLGWLLVLAMPVLAEDDDDDAGNLTPDMQWKFVQKYWDNRHFDEAAALGRQFAEANPDNANALEAWWRVYCIYRDNRPNPDRRKEAYLAGMAACERWEKKYAATDKKRAAYSLWYRVHYAEREIGRPTAIKFLTDLVKKYPGTELDAPAYWMLAEWLREAKRYQEAIPNYQAYVKVAGVSEQSAHALHRTGVCYQELHDNENAIASYNVLLNGQFNWGWGGVHWNVLDIARRLRGMGDDNLARTFAQKIVDKCDRNWEVTMQANEFLGNPRIVNVLPLSIGLHPHLYYHYSTDNQSIDARSKITLVREINLLQRLSNVNKDAPFSGTLTFTPQWGLTKEPTNSPKGEEGKDGKKSYTVNIVAPDSKGNVQGDTWYGFTLEGKPEAPPDGMIVTRKWEKVGDNWGQCTVRIQASNRWHIWIYLPNNKTNPNNFSIQPNEMRDNGKTYRLYDSFDLAQGLTIKFPIEVGTNVAEYYPRIRLERWWGGVFPEKKSRGKEVSASIPELSVKLTSENDFPWEMTFPNWRDVTLNEISR